MVANTRPAPRLCRDRYTGRTLRADRGRYRGCTLVVQGRLYGAAAYVVLVDGARLAWYAGAALRAAIDRQDGLR